MTFGIEVWDTRTMTPLNKLSQKVNNRSKN